MEQWIEMMEIDDDFSIFVEDGEAGYKCNGKDHHLDQKDVYETLLNMTATYREKGLSIPLRIGIYDDGSVTMDPRYSELLKVPQPKY